MEQLTHIYTYGNEIYFPHEQKKYYLLIGSRVCVAIEAKRCEQFDGEALVLVVLEPCFQLRCHQMAHLGTAVVLECNTF